MKSIIQLQGAYNDPKIIAEKVSEEYVEEIASFLEEAYGGKFSVVDDRQATLTDRYNTIILPAIDDL